MRDRSGWQQVNFGNLGSLPAAVGTVRGIRWWSLGTASCLLGATGFRWEPGVNEANCAAGFFMSLAGAGGRHQPWSPPHAVADPICTCGFYAFWEHRWAPAAGGLQPALGIIEGFGTTSIGDLGFRCARARILALHVPDIVPLYRPLLGGPHVLDARWLASLEDARNWARVALEKTFGVPVYETPEAMLSDFPLTSDYARATEAS